MRQRAVAEVLTTPPAAEAGAAGAIGAGRIGAAGAEAATLTRAAEAAAIGAGADAAAAAAAAAAGVPAGGQANSAALRGLPIGVVALPSCTAARSSALGYCPISQ